MGNGVYVKNQYNLFDQLVYVTLHVHNTYKIRIPRKLFKLRLYSSMVVVTLLPVTPSHCYGPRTVDPGILTFSINSLNWNQQFYVCNG